jgi:acyl carrier protein
MHDEIRGYVHDVLQEMTAQQWCEPPGDDTPLGAYGLGLESLYLMQLVTKLEQRYAVAFPIDLGIVLNYTIGDLVNFVSDHTPANETEKS